LVKYSTIRKLGTGNDDFGQPGKPVTILLYVKNLTAIHHIVIVFDLRFPPIFEGQGFNSQELGDRQRKNHKTRDRLVALDDAHARIAPYAHHLRIVLFDQVGLEKFREMCHIAECQPRPIRVAHVYADKFEFFEHKKLYHVERWIKTMDWKIAFQIEACLRNDLLTPHDLLFTLRDAIERVIRDHGSSASQLLCTFSLELQKHRGTEMPSSCLARVCAENFNKKPLQRGHILCHHVIITPSRMLLEGPYATQSNRVIRRYQEHNPAFVERFVRVEFCDEDRLAYRWDREVDGSWFVQRRVGGVLHDGFELAGRSFEFLAYSHSSLREHAVWFVSPFEDPFEGYVNAERIRARLGDLSDLLRTPSTYAARIAQAFTSTDPSVNIRRDQWEEQAELGVHTDGVGTISQELADMIWEEKCRATGNLRENRVKPSAYQFRFLGYKGVVVVDSRLDGIKMRLRGSQCKFPVYNEENAELEIAGSFDTPIPVHLNRFVFSDFSLRCAY
jgi:RNA-dependent RNA polymerase